jgi:hypothetical protein
VVCPVPSYKSLGIKDRVLWVGGQLVLGCVSNESLPFCCEGYVGGGDAVALVVWFKSEFQYKSPCVKEKSATFRVFLSPRYGPKGERLSIHEQRKFYVHLDLFNVEVPPGQSILRRSSISSSLTIPHQQTLSQLNEGDSPNCGCGWPHHLLLPKGSVKGSVFDLFVMATEGSDWVKPETSPCSKPFLFCGIEGGVYPDKRPMGYPFDRRIGGRSASCGTDYGSVWFKVCRIFGGWRNVRFVEEWIEGMENFGVCQVEIVHR